MRKPLSASTDYKVKGYPGFSVCKQTNNKTITTTKNGRKFSALIPSNQRGRVWAAPQFWVRSAMRIGGCQGIGKKTCARKRWCWWRSCASALEDTARVPAARSSATWWGEATDILTQVTTRKDKDWISHFHKLIQSSLKSRASQGPCAS